MIKSSSDNTKIFLISSHSDTKKILKEVAHLPYVIAIYLFDHCQQIATTLNGSITKLHGKFSDLESLSNQLSQDQLSNIIICHCD